MHDSYINTWEHLLDYYTWCAVVGIQDAVEIYSRQPDLQGGFRVVDGFGVGGSGFRVSREGVLMGTLLTYTSDLTMTCQGMIQPLVMQGFATGSPITGIIEVLHS